MNTGKRSYGGAIFAGALLAVIVAVGLWQQNYQMTFEPHGPASARIVATHPVKPNRWVLVEWKFDPDYGSTGWCVWAAEPGKPARWHLVLGGDGETVYSTRPEWWRTS